jgi:hypothetical protein
VGPTRVKSGSSGLRKHVKARISQISSQDKLLSTNKQSNSCYLTEKWDREGRLNQVGPRGSKVKALVKTPSLPGGGLRGTKIKGCGPLWWSENHHKVGGVADVLLQQGVHLPCNLLWGDGGPHRKMVKIKGSWDMKFELVDFTKKQISITQT